MTWFRLPLFVWAIYATSILQVFATPVIGITMVLLTAERFLGIGFFDPGLDRDVDGPRAARDDRRDLGVAQESADIAVNVRYEACRHVILVGLCAEVNPVPFVTHEPSICKNRDVRWRA